MKKPDGEHLKPDAMLAPEDRETIVLLNEGLERLDEWVPVLEPKTQWLELQLAEHAAALRKRFIRDLLLFLLVAAVVLTGLVAALLKLPAVFIGIQGAVLLACPILLLMKERKRVNSE